MVELKDLKGIGDATVMKLHNVGINTVEALAFATFKELEAVGIQKEAVRFVTPAQELIAKQLHLRSRSDARKKEPTQAHNRHQETRRTT